ncbi:hypothetical protein [Leucothrix arctica]|uniref:O-antigen polymerase n=1 Tax=Leucothrix arctica TaxID=1481894 RepID=A0A317CJG2_9GAMM|nr:hypothetical protein [Leucothrix arctica]PWQ98715.1 hypothetical protein DKT75_02575 [Leucothrix arctica]
MKLSLKKSNLDYLLLLGIISIAILEGALAKWFGVPMTVSMVFRDFLGVLLVCRFFYLKKFKVFPILSAILLVWSVLIISVALLQSMSLSLPIIVSLIGLRFWLLYLWISLSIASLVSFDKFSKSLKFLVYFLIIMTPLVYYQSTLPPSHFLNSDPALEGVGVFILAGDIVRATGTFSFTSGFTYFLVVIIPLVYSFKGLCRDKKIRILSVLCLILMVVFSGSRSTIIWFSIMTLAWLMAEVFSGRMSARYLLVIPFISLVVYFGVTIIFENNIDAYISRFESASEAEKISSRILAIFFGEPYVFNDFKLFGNGIGAGSNAGAIFLSGERGFSLAETEPGRVHLEAGLVGIVWTLIKWVSCILGFIWSFKILIKKKDSFPFLLSLSVFYSFISWPMSGQLSANFFGYFLLTIFLSQYKFYSNKSNVNF